MARAQVCMKPRVLGEHGVLITHSFSFRVSLSCGHMLFGWYGNAVVILGASLHDVAVDDRQPVDGLRQLELNKKLKLKVT